MERRARSSVSKRTVSIDQAAAVPCRLGDVLRHRQDLAVLLDGELRTASPRPPLDDPSPSGLADAGTQLGVVEAAPDRLGERIGVAGGALQHGVSVTAGDLGEGAAIGRHERRTRGHRLDRRQAEPLVQARHDRQLGLGVELDDALVGHPGHERDRVAEAVRVDEVHALAGLGPADDRQRHVTFGAQLGDGLDEVPETLEGDVGRCRRDQAAGDPGDVGQRPEQLGVDADGHEPHAVDG